MKIQDQLLSCPKCNNEIQLTESLIAPIIKNIEKKYTAQLAKKELEITNREKDILIQKENLNKEKKEIDKQLTLEVEKKVNNLRNQIMEEEKEKAKSIVEIELKANADKILESDKYAKSLAEKLAASQKKEIEFIRERRVLADEKRELELNLEKKLQEEVAKITTIAETKAQEVNEFKIKEKNFQIDSMRTTIAELQRKSNQGSQQIQGEVQEIELETLLSNKFLDDLIEPVPKGEFGADIIQYVKNSNGITVGKILWESKRTKNWNSDWVSKLKNDQRLIEAEIAVIATHALPKNMRNFEQIDDIWIVRNDAAISIAIVLRQTLLEIFRVKKVSEGQKTKMEILYKYLTGERFYNRVITIMEAFNLMQRDLEKERKVITKQWDKRRIQIENVISTTAGMHGDLQGIVGDALKEVGGLSLEALEHSDNKDQHD